MKKLFLALMMMLPMAVMAQAKFGHLNSADIIQVMPEYTAAQTEMQTLQKQFEDELKRMQDEFKTKMEDYEKNQATLPDAVKQRRETELQDLNQRMQQYYQTSQEELTKAQQTKMQAISSKIVEAIKKVGQEGGFVYIMDTSSGIPYISTTLSTDVTALVKTKLGLK